MGRITDACVAVGQALVYVSQVTAEVARAVTWVAGAWAAYNVSQFIFRFPN